MYDLVHVTQILFVFFSFDIAILLLRCIGTNADKTLSEICWRLLYIFLCISIHQPFLDFDHVRYLVVEVPTKIVEINCVV